MSLVIKKKFQTGNLMQCFFFANSPLPFPKYKNIPKIFFFCGIPDQDLEVLQTKKKRFLPFFGEVNYYLRLAFQKLFLFWYKLLIRRQDWFISESKIFVGKIAKIYEISKGRILTLGPHPINEIFFGNSKSVSKHRPKNVILYCGSLIPRKNFGLLIETFSLLKKKNPAMRLVCAVTLNEPLFNHKKLFEEAKITGIEFYNKNFNTPVPFDEIKQFYGLGSVYVNPSFFDPMNRSVEEALAMGLPIVINENNGLKDFISPKVYELYKSDNSADFAIAILRAIEKSKSCGFAKKAREEAQKFRPKIVAKKFEKLIFYAIEKQKLADKN